MGGPQPEPGATATERAGHNRPEAVDSTRAQFGQRMAAEDIADITHIVTRPRHVAVDEMLIRLIEQEQQPRPGGVSHYDQPAAWAMIGNGAGIGALRVNGGGS